ncbi:MAG: transporter substrate-binding domain-containing protein [Magnetococcales bacterium]|nr:transporter substrate-binding domain-containing protein [Magnetococcales bacterium]
MDLRVLVLFVFLLLPGGFVTAENRPTLALLDFFPFGRAGDSGKPIGLMVDMIREIEKASGIPIDIKLMPIPRALRSVTLGEADLMISYKDDQMLPGVTFLGNMGCLQALLIPHGNSHISSLDDLTDKRIGFISKGYFHIKFAHQFGLIPVEVPSNESMLHMTLRHWLDGFVINSIVLGAYKKGLAEHAHLPGDWQTKLGTPIILETMETHLSISRRSKLQHLIPVLSKAVETVKKQGLFQQLYDRYGGVDASNCGDLSDSL